MYHDSAKPILIMFVDPLNKYHNEYINIFTKSALKFEDRVKFTWINSTSQDYLEKKHRLGLITKILPAVAFNSRNLVNYPFPEGKEINEKNLDYFVQDFLENKKNSYVSVYTPQDIDLSNCQTLSGEDFYEKVTQEGFDAAVLLYSSHNNKESEKTAVIYNNICKKLSGFGYLNLYVFDAATQKGHQSLRLNKFPSIFMSPAYKKQQEYVYYTGKDNEVEVIKFIQKYVDVNIDVSEILNSENNKEVKAGLDISESKTEEL